ncbi:MAG: hypothetical protein A3J93_02520 [Candidatus Magasanikbacteria bacterium RIFOXYC2_FULL_42_28]|uniref:Polymerase beta nucleotidyltransferase domain-containing protein n=1 Tax=Candidatus Magasanikbacteria bacterium RIFOXYC2_FULL_42_28 TaxID=1798704 RepID=A0A1F6NVQ1_9BACT|nr:MAG: hypothetical protein A3J93_02520 [Candidatus Magasanikbacteria bacterium RIFOXYC2_FULL_42_28]
MSKDKVKKIVCSYAAELKKSNFPFASIFWFGSTAKGLANKFSDIDVAIFSDKLRRFENSSALWMAGSNVDGRIEPHGFTVADFNDKNNPMVNEIKKTGIRIV